MTKTLHAWLLKIARLYEVRIRVKSSSPGGIQRWHVTLLRNGAAVGRGRAQIDHDVQAAIRQALRSAQDTGWPIPNGWLL